jgi:hypothetical protein
MYRISCTGQRRHLDAAVDRYKAAVSARGGEEFDS